MVKRVNKRKLPGFEAKTLRVGYFGTQKYPDGTSLAEVAQWNEYGTKTSPPRPFMRYAVEENGQSWVNTLKERLKATGSELQALNEVGEMITNDIKDSILNGSYVGNTPLTLLLKDRFPMGDYSLDDFLKTVDDFKKGERATGSHDKPLVWSGMMLRSITKRID